MKISTLLLIAFYALNLNSEILSTTNTCLDINNGNGCPIPNDEASGAIPITMDNYWGQPGWDTFAVGGATPSLQPCDGGPVANDTWYSFVAQAENTGVLARPNPNNPQSSLMDLVIQVFDSNMIPLSGLTEGSCEVDRSCFNNVGENEIERALPTGLTVGQTYFYRVYDANGIMLQCIDQIDTKVKTYVPHVVVAGCGSVASTNHIFSVEDPLNMYNIPPVPVFETRLMMKDLAGNIVATTPSQEAIAGGGDEEYNYTLSDFDVIPNDGNYIICAQHLIKMHANGCVSVFWSQLSPECEININLKPLCDCVGGSPNEDTTPPLFNFENVPGFLNEYCGQSEPTIFPTATDNCDSNVEVTYENIFFSGGCVGAYERIWTATDDCGNSSSFSQVVELFDDVDPFVISSPSDVIIECGDPVPNEQPIFGDACDNNLDITFIEQAIGTGCDAVITRTWTAEDECGNIASTSQTISFGTSNFEPFITTWVVSSDDLEIRIPTHGNGYNFTVDWGDGNIEPFSGTDPDPIHQYLLPDEYVVEISGDFPRIYFADGIDNDKILSIDQWGDIGWSSMQSAFSECTELRVLANDIPDLTSVDDMSGIFYGATSLNDFIGDWNVSNVVNMNSAFRGATDFNQALNDWNVDNVEFMYWMFADATAFNQSLNNWNVQNVQSVDYMFRNAINFNQDLNSWMLINVQSLSGMFEGAISFNGQLNLNYPNLANNMSYMFKNAWAFNKDISNWNVSSVVFMNSMFQSANIFNQDIGGWDVSSATDMDNMFRSAALFNQDLGGWDIQNVSDMTHMLLFGGLSTLNYDLTLTGWADLIPNVQPNVPFHAGSSQYCFGDIARVELMNQGWIIDDNGLDPMCNGSTIDSNFENNNFSHKTIFNTLNLNIYPNPNSGERLNFSITNNPGIDGDIHVEIYDSFGRKIHTSNITHETFDINGVINLDQKLPTGLYTVVLNINDQILTKKLTIQ